MATPAAAALFAKALEPLASTTSSSSSSQTHHLPANPRAGTGGDSSLASRLGNARTYSARGSSTMPSRGGGSRGGGGGGVRGDDNMLDFNDQRNSGAKRRGRVTRGPNPMGVRPTNHNNDNRYPSGSGSSNNNSNSGNNGRHMPNDLRNPPRASGSSSSQPPPSSSAIETLRVFLVSRYSEEAKMLNLENMAGDPLLRAAGLKAPGEKGAPTNVAGAMWKLAGSLFPDVVTLSLANNSLTSLLPLSPYLLVTFLPNLINVSLASNSLGRVQDVDNLSPIVGRGRRDDGKGKGWSQLRELVLSGNPLVETGSREMIYRSEIARRFPSLQQLDQQPIDSATMTFAAAYKAKLSRPVPSTSGTPRKGAQERIVFPLSTTGGFFESDGTRDFVAAFFMKFFPAYDSARSSLSAVYASTCTFSFFADTTAPSRAKAKRIGGYTDKLMPFQRALSWKGYTTPEGSRNLSRVKLQTKRLATLQINPNDVINSIMKLPITAHPLTDPSKFVFDAWTMPGLMAPTAPGMTEGETVIYATVHGEFTEFPAKGIRSFDRTFILAPAAPGSTAHQAGWSCVILSDLLTLRSYSDPKAWSPPLAPSEPSASSSAAAASTTLNGPIVVERAEGLSDAQQTLILALQHHTSLTYAFAHLCLAQNGWDAVEAMRNFVALKLSGGIPAEAFIVG